MLEDLKRLFTPGGQLSRRELERAARQASEALHPIAGGFAHVAEQAIIDTPAGTGGGSPPTPPPDVQDTRYQTILLQAVVQQVTLAAGIGAGDTTIPVSAPATYIPFGTIILQIDAEQLSATYDAGLNGNNWTVARGVNGTAAAPHLKGATVSQIQIQVRDNALFQNGGAWLQQDQQGLWHVASQFDIFVDTDTLNVRETMTVYDCDRATGLLWFVFRGINGTTIAAHPNWAGVGQLKPAIQTTLAQNLDNQQVVMQVVDVSKFPSFERYILSIEPETGNEERVLVIDGTGATLRVVRGYDGTTAKAHQSQVLVVQVLGDLVKSASRTIFEDQDLVQPGSFLDSSKAALHHEVLQFVRLTSTTLTGNGYYPAVLEIWDGVNHLMLDAYPVWAKDINS